MRASVILKCECHACDTSAQSHPPPPKNECLVLKLIAANSSNNTYTHTHRLARRCRNRILTPLLGMCVCVCALVTPPGDQTCAPNDCWEYAPFDIRNTFTPVPDRAKAIFAGARGIIVVCVCSPATGAKARVQRVIRGQTYGRSHALAHLSANIYGIEFIIN